MNKPKDQSAIERLGEEMFFSNEHVCPDCGRGNIGDKPIQVKHLWIFSKFTSILSKELAQAEREGREEAERQVDDSDRYIIPDNLLTKYKLLKDLPSIPAGTIFIEERDPERCGYRFYPDLETDINMQFNSEFMLEDNPDWFEALKKGN